jgi:uncharacterized protein (TIGR00730 family)
MTTASICVYCGSRFGADPGFELEADALGRAIAGAGWRLVYGAGDIGLMGAVARGAIAAGGETLGAIPKHLLDREVGKQDLTALVVTETMHERKKVMVMNADAIVVMPGGAGTLDEFFEVLTWRQLGLHSKPIIVMDVSGFWEPLHALVEHVITAGFADRSLAGFVQTGGSAAEVMALLRAALDAEKPAAE